MTSPDHISVLVGGRTPLAANNSVIAVRQEEELELTCATMASGGPPPPPVWTADNGDVLLPRQESRTGRVAGGDNDDLFFFAASSLSGLRLQRQLSPADTSPPAPSRYQQLTCRTPTQAISLLLDVEFQPEFTISRTPGFGVPIVEGTAVTLRCSVEANPSAAPFWEHNGARLKGSSSHQTEDISSATEVYFEAIQQGSEGWYQCSAEHKFGNFSSVGYYLSVKPRSGGLVTAGPSGQTPAGDQGRRKSGSSETGQRTTSSELAEQVVLVERTGLPASSARQQGRDCAHQDNPVREEGEVERLLSVTPQGKTITVAEGETVHLQIEFCSDAPVQRVFWSGPGPLLLAAGQSGARWAAGSVRSVPGSDSCEVAELSAGEAVQEDAGHYLLVVLTDGGQVAAGRLTLQVAAAPSAASSGFLLNCAPLGTVHVVLCLLFFFQYEGAVP